MKILRETLKIISTNSGTAWLRVVTSHHPPEQSRYPKMGRGTRVLGIPTVADCIVQMVVKEKLEPMLEPHFHPSSYGYRPGKSALEAVGMTRKMFWLLDVGIEGFSDNIDHSLLLMALRKHKDCKWILLYVGRWLKVPSQLEDGGVLDRKEGTPQGGVISPLLANLFLHYALDMWMCRNYPDIPFERYADDGIVHLKSESQTKVIKEAIGERLARCRLKLHPEKTRIVYCKDVDRKGSYPHKKFDFLGYTFKPRGSKNRKGNVYVNFSPAVSDEAVKHMRQTIRSWRLHL